MLCLFPRGFSRKVSCPRVWGKFPSQAAMVAAGIQVGLQKGIEFRSLSSREAYVVLTSFNYLFNASTDDVLNLLELRCQQGFSKLFSQKCSGLWVSVHNLPGHLNSPGRSGCPFTFCSASSWCGCFPCPCTDLPASARIVPLLQGSSTLQRLLHFVPFFPAKVPFSNSPGISAEREVVTPP